MYVISAFIPRFVRKAACATHQHCPRDRVAATVALLDSRPISLFLVIPPCPQALRRYQCPDFYYAPATQTTLLARSTYRFQPVISLMHGIMEGPKAHRQALLRIPNPRTTAMTGQIRKATPGFPHQIALLPTPVLLILTPQLMRTI